METKTETVSKKSSYDPEELVHYYCCNEDVGLCGQDDLEGPENLNDPVCPFCETLAAMNLPCSDPHCDIRVSHG